MLIFAKYHSLPLSLLSSHTSTFPGPLMLFSTNAPDALSLSLLSHHLTVTPKHTPVLISLTCSAAYSAHSLTCFHFPSSAQQILHCTIATQPVLLCGFTSFLSSLYHQTIKPLTYFNNIQDGTTRVAASYTSSKTEVCYMSNASMFKTVELSTTD